MNSDWAPYGFVADRTAPYISSYKCPECSFTVDNIARITEHVAVEHVEYAPYRCVHPSCGAGRFSMQKLAEHIEAKKHGDTMEFRYKEDLSKRSQLMSMLSTVCNDTDAVRSPLSHTDHGRSSIEADEVSRRRKSARRHPPQRQWSEHIPNDVDDDIDTLDVDVKLNAFSRARAGSSVSPRCRIGPASSQQAETVPQSHYTTYRPAESYPQPAPESRVLDCPDKTPTVSHTRSQVALAPDVISLLEKPPQNTKRPESKRPPPVTLGLPGHSIQMDERVAVDAGTASLLAIALGASVQPPDSFRAPTFDVRGTYATANSSLAEAEITSSLSDHIDTTTGSAGTTYKRKTSVCLLCGEETTYKRRHVYKHLNKPIVSCRYCGKYWTHEYSSNAQDHLKSHHGVLGPTHILDEREKYRSEIDDLHMQCFGEHSRSYSRGTP